MKTDRLQLTWIPDLRPAAQPLPGDARAEAVELIARMLLRLARAEPTGDGVMEVSDESR